MPSSYTLSGFLYNNAGVAVSGATVNTFARNAVTGALSTTTTDTSGYWALSPGSSQANMLQVDVQLTNAATGAVRRIKYDDVTAQSAVITRNLHLSPDTNQTGTSAGFFTTLTATAMQGDSHTVTFPDATGTLPILSFAQTWSADQTFTDNTKITLGTGGDADLYYDATNVVLNPKVVGSGVFKVLGNIWSTVSLKLATGATVTGILDEDAMGTNSDTQLATQQSIKAYVDAKVATADTLSEVLALGNTSGSTSLVITSGQVLTTNTINETTAASGVTIDSVLLKDNTVTATTFVGALTGNVTGNTSGTAATVTTPEQGNITSLGTLSAVTVSGLITANGGITFAAGDDIAFTGGTGTNDIVLTNGLADALSITDGSADVIAISTAGATNTVAITGNLTVSGTIDADTAAVATAVTITDNENENESNAIIFGAGADLDGGNIGLESDGDLTYNPSTGKITASGFIGALTGNADTVTTNADLTGDVTSNGNATTIAGLAYSKLAALADGNILVGNGSNVAVSVNPSGDVDVSNAGVFSIASGVIVNDDINASAAIAVSKTALSAGTGLTLSTNSLAITPAQTTITSIHATDLIIGEDAQTAIDFGTENEIDFKINNTAELTLDASSLYPIADAGLDLGTATLGFNDLHLGSAGILNFDNANMTITHSDTVLTVAGGTFATAALTATTFAPTDDITLAADKSLNLPQGANIDFTDVIANDGIDDHDAQGVIFTFNAGATVTPFSPVYLAEDNLVEEANATAIATMPCIGVSINTSDVTTGNPVKVLVMGLIRDNDFAFGTHGAAVYVSTTVGTMTSTAPSGTNNVVQVIGHSIEDDAIFVQPCLTTIEHA
jgi:hypothetical protein